MRILKWFIAGLVAAGVLGCSGAGPDYEYALLGPKVPEGKPEPAPAPPEKVDESWRTAQPEVGPTPAPVIPKFAQAELQNGLKVIASEQKELPLVSVAFAVRAGSAADDKGKAGLADFTYELMLEGAAKRDGVALAEAFADLGTEISVETQEDGAAFTVTVLKKNLEPCLALISDIVLRPTFKPKDFKRKKEERKADLMRLESSPRYLSRVGLGMEVFGLDHPYGHPAMGTVKSLEKIKLANARQFHKRQVVPSASALVFAGDITLDEAEQMTETLFGKWKGPAAKEKPPKEKGNLGPRKRVAVIPQPGLNQTVIAMGTPAMEAGHQDEWALSIAVDVFGGMFGSRLNMNLREDKGYTYGARAMMDAYRYNGSLIASSSVHAHVTGAALGEFIKELSGLHADKQITQQEFETARDNVLRSVSGWFESLRGVSTAGTRIFFRDLPLDRYEKMVQGYSRLTLEDARQAAVTYLAPENMKVLLVGDMDLIKEQISKMNLGEIQEVILR